MHFAFVQHCGYCEHFVRSFSVDMTIDWGFCRIQAGDNPPSEEEVKAVKKEVKAGNYQVLQSLASKLGLFIPDEDTICEHFSTTEEDDDEW